MSNWKDLYNAVGHFESDVIDITSDFDYYINELELTYDKLDGEVSIHVRVTFDDGVTWSEWYNITGDSFFPIFDNNGIVMNHAKMQYKIVLDNSSNPKGNSPEFKNFLFKLIGTFKLMNTGDVVCKPDIWITKKNGFGTVRVINETNGQVMEIKDLNNGETVFIDCENEDIVSDLPRVYRYNNHNGVFLKLEVGENLICGEGDFELNMRYEFKTLQG